MIVKTVWVWVDPRTPIPWKKQLDKGLSAKITELEEAHGKANPPVLLQFDYGLSIAVLVSFPEKP